VIASYTAWLVRSERLSARLESEQEGLQPLSHTESTDDPVHPDGVGNDDDIVFSLVEVAARNSSNETLPILPQLPDET